jgi:hypothetical protein
MKVMGSAHRAIDRKRDDRRARDEAEDRAVDQFLSALGSTLVEAAGSRSGSYQVHLVDGRRMVATLPADGTGPEPSYTVNGRRWRVRSHSARHDEGPGRYAWTVLVEHER